MSDFNSELATVVRRQNHEMSNWHIIGVGNIQTLFKVRPDLSTKNVSQAEAIWLSNLVKRAPHIKQTIEQYKKEITDLAAAFVADPDNDPETDTGRSKVYVKKLEEILNRLRMLVAMGTQLHQAA